MLQQILQTMYIDPELLESLSDEDRIRLFRKMRQEQVKRWDVWQVQLEQEEKQRRKPKLPPKPGSKKVHFLLGVDGNPWTWVIDDVDRFHGWHELKSTQIDTQANLNSCQNGFSVEDEEDVEDREVKVTLSKAKLLTHVLEQNSLDKERANWLKRKQERIMDNDSSKRETGDARNAGDIPEVRQVYALLRDTQKKATDMQDSIRRSFEGRNLTAKKDEHNAQDVDNKISEIARRARVLLSAKSSVEAVDSCKNNIFSHAPQSTTLSVTGLNHINNIRTNNRPEKPPSRESIVEWFRSVERPRGTGWDADANAIAPWFHGMVTRREAEEMLTCQPVGTYLIRFCERIWGYVLSYRATIKCKHTMIEAVDDHYRFLDGSCRKFHKLADLVLFCQSGSFVSNDAADHLSMPCPRNNNDRVAELFDLPTKE